VASQRYPKCSRYSFILHLRYSGVVSITCKCASPYFCKIFIVYVKKGARFWGGKLSSNYLVNKTKEDPNFHPLKDTMQMQKFCDQSWQLAIHIIGSIIGIFLLICLHGTKANLNPNHIQVDTL
jgi:hypothetical protein